MIWTDRAIAQSVAMLVGVCSVLLLMPSPQAVGAAVGPSSDGASGEANGGVASVVTADQGEQGGYDPEANVALEGAGNPPQRPRYIREYRVSGAKVLPPVEVEKAVYPFLGPGRTEEDIELARAALEAAYIEAGYQTVTVEIPQQQIRAGIVQLQVNESPVGRLRVRGARYYLPSHIKARARSVAEGRVIQFNDLKRDIVSLNQLADRRVTPDIQIGFEPGTVDVDLNVEDSLPLHGNVELNNRYSPDTVPLRLSAGINYGNLWQLGHTAGFSFQVAPEKPEDTTVYAAFYLMRFPGYDGFSLLFQGTKQDSDVSTLGGAAVAGRGETIGMRGLFTLPSREDFFHSISAGFDYKTFRQNVVLGLDTFETPIFYYPLNISYSATWAKKGKATNLNAAVNFHPRGLGSSPQQFDDNRFKADGNYLYFRGDLAHTREFGGGFQLFVRAQGQVASEPLIPNEQFAAGGLDTVRGYLEGEVLGDHALLGTLELRSPSLLGNPESSPGKFGEWRVYVFADGGFLELRDPLPEQEASFRMASVGFGSAIRILDRLSGSIDAAWPLVSQSVTVAHDPFVNFRVWADF